MYKKGMTTTNLGCKKMVGYGLTSKYPGRSRGDEGGLALVGVSGVLGLLLGQTQKSPQKLQTQSVQTQQPDVIAIGGVLYLKE